MCSSLFLIDEGLLSIISAGWCLLVKMLITIEPDGVFDFFIHFLIGWENDKETKNYKEKILITGGYEPLCARLLDYKKTLDHSATTYDIHTRAIYQN